MKNRKLKYSAVFLMGLGLTGLNAQEVIPAAGGESSGSGGSVSYTIGQILYNQNEGNNGSEAQGVQQPYEISEVIGLDEAVIDLEVSVYPNPTTNYLTLKIGEGENEELTWQLTDMTGKVLKGKRLDDAKTEINTSELPAATYFLNLRKKDQTVKSFKIIKTH